MTHRITTRKNARLARLDRPLRPRSVDAHPAIVGALGGLALAIVDVLPAVMWLPDLGSRAWLIVRVVGLLTASGALVGAAFASLHAVVERWLPRRSLTPLIVTAGASFPIAHLVSSTFSGPAASRIPAVTLVELLAVVTLNTVCFVAVHLATTRSPPQGRIRRGAMSTCIAMVVIVIIQCSRLLYPRHYEPIHGALAAVALVLSIVAVALALPRARLSAFHIGLPVALALLIAASVLAPLRRDHDGRAALLSPRNASSRSFMLLASPVLFASAQRASDAARGEAERSRAARVAATSSLAFPGAHLVIITIDALRADHLGLYGYARPTSPNLDRLAAESVVFDRAWSATPRSSYSLSSLLRGRPTFGLASQEGTTLADALGRGQLYTAAFYPDGIFFHDGERFDAIRARSFGFIRRDAENHDAVSLTDAVLAELADLHARGEPQSFFWIHYFDVHEPYEERSLGDRPIDRYDGEIQNVDRALARVLDALDALERDVVLMITADHGEEFRDHGGTFHGDSLYEEQLHVPWLIHAPGLPPHRVAGPVSLVDLAPTALALLGAAPLSDATGQDLRATLLGEPFDRGPVFATERGMRAVLRWPDKLIEEPSLGSLELFDLEEDPRERRSLTGARPDQVDRLLGEWPGE